VKGLPDSDKERQSVARHRQVDALCARNGAEEQFHGQGLALDVVAELLHGRSQLVRFGDDPQRDPVGLLSADLAAADVHGVGQAFQNEIVADLIKRGRVRWDTDSHLAQNVKFSCVALSRKTPSD